MGRRAKALTIAEKKAQAQAKQYERRQTAHSRGLMATQRYNAYRRAHGRQGSTPQRLPNDLIALAIQELPINSKLFQAASKSAEMLDETGMDVWDSGPPYTTGPPSDTPREVEHTERMKEVAHGRHVRLQREEAIIWQRSSLSELKILLDAAVHEWKVGRRFLADYEDGPRERAMAELWLQWVARRAYDLHSEVSYYHIV